MFNLFGKVALVTGGASGIGLSTVEQLLENGIKGVTIADLNDEKGKDVVDNFNKKYGDKKALFVKVNVADRNQFINAFKLTVDTFQNLDIVINVAGIVKDFVWEEEIAVNLGGTVTGTYFAFEEYLPKYKSGPEGVVVNVSSINALEVYAYAPIYSATKSGVIMLSRCYGSSVHYERKQTRVMAVCPGYTDTPIHRIYPERLLDPSFNSLKTKLISEKIIQPATHVAKCIVTMIREGENGSVWVVEDCKQPYQINFLKKEECVQ